LTIGGYHVISSYRHFIKFELISVSFNSSSKLIVKTVTTSL